MSAEGWEWDGTCASCGAEVEWRGDYALDSIIAAERRRTWEAWTRLSEWEEASRALYNAHHGSGMTPQHAEAHRYMVKEALRKWEYEKLDACLARDTAVADLAQAYRALDAALAALVSP